MREIVVVDGYNILHAWPDMLKIAQESSLEHSRVRLIEAFSNYQGVKQCKVMIVFDSHHVGASFEKTEKVGNLEIIYSGQGQTADMVIERLVGELITEGRVYVATSDYNEQRIVFGRGAYRVSAREMIQEVKTANREALEYSSEKIKIANNQLGARLKGDIIEVFEKWRREK